MVDQRLNLLSNENNTDTLDRSEYTSIFFIYHCKACSQIIVISKTQLSGKQIDTMFKEKCPTCTLPLFETMSCRSAQAPVDTHFWRHPQIDLRTYSERLHDVKFTSAASLFGVSAHLDFVDRLVGGLRPETIIFIKGNISTLIAERYCVRAQLPEYLGGLQGRALFIDGGNSFDVYLYASIAREYGLDLDGALNRIVLSRAFTPYELLQLVSKDINEIFEVYHPQLLVVSDIFQLFKQNIEKEEAKRILYKMGYGICRISKQKRIPIVVTSVTRSDEYKFIFRDYCTVDAEFSEEKNQIISRLIKHPSKTPIEMVQESHNLTCNQRLLMPFETMLNG
jgi:hypothetical protein